jgi:MATE family multidrug resistance protein
MLGHLPQIRFLAGVALGSILFDYIYWSFGFLRMGSTGVTAQAVGRQDRDAEYGTLLRFGAIAIAVALLILLLQSPLKQLGFSIFGGESGTEAAGLDYFNARIWGAPATLLNFVLMGWFLGRSQARNVLVMTAVANLANIGLNYLFIMRLGWAAAGAGYATMLSQYACLLTAIVLYRMRHDRHLPTVTVRSALKRAQFRGLGSMNRDLVLRTVLLISVFASFIDLSARMGTVVLAANSILIRMLNLAAYLIDGAAFATETLAGRLLGAGDRAGLRRLTSMAVISGVGFALLCLLVYLVNPRGFLSLLTSHTEVIDVAQSYIYWLIPCLLFGAVAYLFDGLFLGWTKARTLLLSMAFSVLVVYAPLAYWGWRTSNNQLLWIALTLCMLARATTLAFAARRTLRQLA